MRIRARLLIPAFLWSALLFPLSPEKPVWPLTLREGLPASLPGYAAAPTESLPEEDENEMGPYTEVARFFQHIESPAATRQFRLAVQDYGAGKKLIDSIRRAVVEAARQPHVETRELQVSGLKTFVVTDRSQGKPTTLVTVVVTPSRLVLGQGANVTGEEAVKLLSHIDFAKVAAAR